MSNTTYNENDVVSENSEIFEAYGEEMNSGSVAALPPPPVRKRGLTQKKRNRLIFYSCFIALPVIHFLLFYVYINFNSILMAFQKYTYTEPVVDTIMDTYIPGGYTASFAGFENFVAAWKNFSGFDYRIWNALVFAAVNILICTPLALLFSYYLYKQYFLSGFFKVVLFLPQLLSALVLGLLFKYIAADVYLYFARLFEKLTDGKIKDITDGAGLLETANVSTRYMTVIFFNIMLSFGVNVLTYTSTMGGINDSLIESAQLDGANGLQEFLHIVLPLSYPTISTLLVVNISHIFTNQAHLLTLYKGGPGKLETVGYFLYTQAKSEDSKLWYVNDANLTYPQLSAYGLICTAIIMPTTLIVRKLLNKYGPSAD